MLDLFLQASLEEEKTASAKQQKVAMLRRLPNTLLMKIASGQEKLAYFHDGDSSWLDRFKGTPLFEQALQIEQEDLQAQMDRKAKSQESSERYREEDSQREDLSIKRKMLELDLAKSQEGGSDEEEDLPAPPLASPAPVGEAKEASLLGAGARLLTGGAKGVAPGGATAALKAKMAPSAFSAPRIGGWVRTPRLPLPGGWSVGQKQAMARYRANMRKYAASEGHSGLAMAALPVVGALTGASLYGAVGLGRSGVPALGKRLAIGGGAGGGLGIAAAGLIGMGALLDKADPSGRTLKTVIELAPAAIGVAGAVSDMRKEAVSAGWVAKGMMGGGIQRTGKVPFGSAALAKKRVGSMADRAAQQVPQSQMGDMKRQMVKSFKQGVPALKTAQASESFAQKAAEMGLLEKNAVNPIGIVQAAKGMYRAGRMGSLHAVHSAKAVSDAAGKVTGATARKGGIIGAARGAGNYWQGLAKRQPGMAAGMVAAPALAAGYAAG